MPGVHCHFTPPLTSVTVGSSAPAWEAASAPTTRTLGRKKV